MLLHDTLNMYDTYWYVNTSSHTGRYYHVWKIVEHSNINKDTQCALHFRTYWYTIKYPSDVSL